MAVITPGLHPAAPKKPDLASIYGADEKAGSHEQMRIAQIAPLTESVPPRTYGGTERVVSYLTEELMAMGHDVTLFASGDSVTTAKLEAAWPWRCGSTPRCATPWRRKCC